MKFLKFKFIVSTALESAKGMSACEVINDLTVMADLV